MKKSLSLAVAAVLAVSAFAGVSQASAATEFGNSCTGSAPDVGSTLLSIKNGSTTLAATAPISGVITEWKTNLNVPAVEPEEEAFFGNLYRQTLDVFKSAGGNSFTLVAESYATSPLNFHGATTSLSRIPVTAGEYVGLGGFSPLYCESTNPAEEIGFIEGSMAVGSTKSFETEPEVGVPVVARVEPDVDGDGYGDETQDKCPQSAAYQTACPMVTISSKPFVAGKKAVTLYVSTSLSAPVGVTATVNLGKGKKATLTAATQTVAPGTLAPFKLTLSGKVTKALAELSTKKSLTMSITASATNVTGAPSTSTSSVKLRGQAKPGASSGGKKKSHKSGKKPTKK